MADDGSENKKMPDAHRITWRKSTKSAQSDCVEAGKLGDAVFVRDSKDRRGPVLEFTTRQWRAMISDIETARLG